MKYLPCILLAMTMCSGVTLAQIPTLGGGGRAAQGPTSGEQVTRVKLILGRNAIAPGQSMQVGLMFEMDPHWHIYWKNPGEAGMPPRVKWHLPEGFTISDLQWPTPIQFDQGGGIIGYGYLGKVMFTATVMAPPAEKFMQSKTVNIAADVDWLVCKDVCLPGGTQVSADLPVGEGRLENEKLFAYWLDQLPVKNAVKVVKVEGTASTAADKQVKLTLGWDKPVGDVVFYPMAAENFTMQVIESANHDNQTDVTLSVHLMGAAKSDVLQVHGLAVWTVDGNRRSAEVDFPLAVSKNP